MGVYIPNRSYPVIVQIRDAIEALAGLYKAQGVIIFGANATTTKIITIYSIVFEFLASGTAVSPAITVRIGSTLTITRNNLLAALASLIPVELKKPLVTAVAVSTNEIDLTYYDVGSVGNVTITTDDGNITVDGMSGGTDAEG